MERRKVVITRLRSTEYYTGTKLKLLIDAIYHLLDKFVENNEDIYDIDTHNCSIPSREKKRSNVRDYQRLTDADVVVIPSEVEFAYNIYGRIGNFMMSRSWIRIRHIRNAFLENPKPRKIIIISSDQADTIELYRDKVFKDIPNLTFYRLDESEFPAGIHHLRYVDINDLNLDKTKKVDFCYWGTSKRLKVDPTSELRDYNVKDYLTSEGLPSRQGAPDTAWRTVFTEPLYVGKVSEDVRHKILKQIYLDDTITNNMIGYFDGFKYTHKFEKEFTKILPQIAESKYTLCFNWPGADKFLTARYNESLACDTLPLVWQNYDCDNQLVLDDRQRMFSFDDIRKTITETTDEYRAEWLGSIKEKYDKVAMPTTYYEMVFGDKLKTLIDKNGA